MSPQAPAIPELRAAEGPPADSLRIKRTVSEGHSEIRSLSWPRDGGLLQSSTTIASMRASSSRRPACGRRAFNSLAQDAGRFRVGMITERFMCWTGATLIS